MQFITDGYTGGERALLITPKYTANSQSCLKFYLISTKDSTDDTELDNRIAVYANDFAYPVAGRQVWQTGRYKNLGPSFIMKSLIEQS